MSPVVHKAIKQETLKNSPSLVSVPGPSGPSCFIMSMVNLQGSKKNSFKRDHLDDSDRFLAPWIVML